MTITSKTREFYVNKMKIQVCSSDLSDLLDFFVSFYFKNKYIMIEFHKEGTSQIHTKKIQRKLLNPALIGDTASVRKLM